MGQTTEEKIRFPPKPMSHQGVAEALARQRLGRFEIAIPRSASTSHDDYFRTHRGFDTETGEPVVTRRCQRGWLIRGPSSSSSQLSLSLSEQVLKWELAVVKRLRHPNILQLLAGFQTNRKEIILVYENYNEQENLLSALPLKCESTARRYFQQLVSALLYAQREGVAHGNLCLDCLLLDPVGTSIKIIGFRVNPRPPEDAKMGPVATEDWCPEDVCRQPPPPEPFQRDLWYVGVVLYELVAGLPPFDRRNLRDYLTRIERAAYRALPDHVSETAKDLISKLLVVDRWQRLPLEAIVAHPWFCGEDPDLAASSEARSLVETRGKSWPPVVLQLADVDDMLRFVDEDDEASRRQPNDEIAERESVPPVSAPAAQGLDAFAVCQALQCDPAIARAIPQLFQVSTVSHVATEPFLLRTHTAWLQRAPSPSTATTMIAERITALTTYPPKVSCDNDTTVVKGLVNAPKGLLTVMCHVHATVVPELMFIRVLKGRGHVDDFTALCGALARELAVWGDS